MFYILLFISTLLYVTVASNLSLEIARYLCRDKPTMYSFRELQDYDREDQCCWRGIFLVLLVIPVGVLML